jgi:glycosyltransferase involved in cell wall biosynthesis
VVASDMYFPFRDLTGLLEGAGAKDTSRKRPTGREEVEGFTVHRLPSAVETFYDLILVTGLRPILEELRPDVVHAHEPRQGTPAMAARHRDLGYAYVIDQHGYASSYGEDVSLRTKVVRAEYDMLRRPMSNYAFRRADAIVAVTDMSKRFLVEHHGVDPDRIQVLPLGVETDIFHRVPGARERIREEEGLRHDDVLIVTAGRLDPAKGLERFIEALGRAKAPEGAKFRLILSGSGNEEYLEKLKASAKEHLRPDQISFRTFMARDRLPEFFSAADVGVWGKAAITILEAMACGLPVVVPDDEASAHLVSHGNGASFPAGAPHAEAVEALVPVLERMMVDAGERKAMGEKAVEAVRERYDYRVRTKKLMQIYRVALALKKSGGYHK